MGREAALLRKRYKHLGRLKEIANTLARHGFGFIIEQLGLSSLVRPHLFRKAADPGSLAGHLRQVLEELGPTAIKLGQVLSTRADLLPKEIIAELAKLQDRVPPFPFAQVKEQIERELEQPLECLFAEFRPEPLAAASLGQVHYARLLNGAEVVVKVQRPGIEKIIDTDLQIIRDAARWAQRHTLWGRMYDLVEMAEEFARTLKEELDYYSEGRNAEIFRENFAADPSVYIPRIYWDYTTSRVLTMEYLRGIKLNDGEALVAQGYDLRRIAMLVANAFLRMVLFHGFFHADPHPGNIYVLDGPVVAFMDFGMVGRIAEEHKEPLLNLVLGLLRNDSHQVLEAIAKMGVSVEEAKLPDLRREIERLRDRYYDLPLHRISLGQAVEEMWELAYKYHLQIPAQFTMLARGLLTVEGVVQELAPELSLMALARPLGQELVRQKFSPQNLVRRLRETAEAYGETLLGLPGKLDRVLSKMERDQLTLRLEHPQWERALKKADRISNRLTFAAVLLAFSLIMTGLLISSALLGTSQGPLSWPLPVLEAGFLAAGLMFFWLIFVIFRSGGL